MPEKMIAANRIRDLRKGRNWSQEQMAEKMGTTKATVSKLERGHMQLTVEWVQRLAKAMNVNWENILSGAAEDPRFRNVPVIGLIAAGSWQDAVQEPLGYVGCLDVGPNAFALKPVGDSMDRIIQPGAKVVIDPDQTDLVDGRIFAVMNGDGQTTLKRFRNDPARLEPESTNAEHRAFRLGQEPIRVIGRAVQVVMTL